MLAQCLGLSWAVRHDLIQGESQRRLWQMVIRPIIKHQTLSDVAKEGIHARTPSFEYELWQGQGVSVERLSASAAGM